MSTSPRAAAEPAGPGLVRRVRRRADLSQRDLADRLGVSQSTVARWETGKTSPSLSMVHELATLAGLRVALVDDTGSVVPAMRDDAARDRAGRRYPAHVDPWAWGWWMPRGTHRSVEGILAVRRSREQQLPRVHYERGTWRPVLRSLLGTPDDHPTRAQLVASVLARTGETARGTPSSGD